MFKITTMPKETLVELLFYLAENEKFQSVSKDLAGGVTVEEVRSVLRELAVGIAREGMSDNNDDLKTLMKGAGLSPEAKRVVSELSATEGKSLLSAFDLIDE